MHLMLTGATGFLGTGIVEHIHSKRSARLTSIVRDSRKKVFGDRVVVKLLEHNTDWRDILVGVDVVVHLAARAHILNDDVDDPLAEYRRVNVDGTLNLASQAAQAGVRRFVFISSIGVNGIRNSKPFTVDDVPNPVEPYAVSKLEAEEGLRCVSKMSGLEVVIIRPPLIYGPGAPGNFGRLAALAGKNLPLPLGGIHNQRSFVAIDNLVDLIITCVDHPAAANQTFLVSDDHDLSTTELLESMTRAAGKHPRLLPVPAGMLRLGAALLGKKAEADRLLGNLQVDITHTKETLGWQPPVSVEEGIKRCFE